MLPDIGALLKSYSLYAKRIGFEPDRDKVRLGDALHEAGALASGRESASDRQSGYIKQEPCVRIEHD
jgi:hypothetical protein